MVTRYTPPDPLEVACPLCDAPAGQPCRYGGVPDGEPRSTPHTSRRSAAYRRSRENRPTLTPDPNRPTEELRP